LLLVSCPVFVGVLRFVLRHRTATISLQKVISIAVVVVIGGMLFARFGAQAGLPWWIYYPLPMLLSVLLPPWFFSMTKQEASWYIVLAFLSAPVIHIVFSFFLGWHEYMPFLPVPSMQDLLGAG
jgi:hypothetical protein